MTLLNWMWVQPIKSFNYLLKGRLIKVRLVDLERMVLNRAWSLMVGGQGQFSARMLKGLSKLGLLDCFDTTYGNTTSH